MNIEREKLNRSIIREHGRSFFFASRFLSTRDATSIALLYSLCRTLDDLADKSDLSESARLEFAMLSSAIHEKDSSEPIVQDLISMGWPISTCTIMNMISGIKSDFDLVRMQDEYSLHRYCYMVAGTVGLMMCDLLNVRDSKAFPHAIDLGIAMQMTNIARDVFEDAQNNRRYLPATWIGTIEPNVIVHPQSKDSEIINKGVRKILLEAEKRYESGEAGLAFLPWRTRFAILLAARLYREIGKKICSNNCSIWLGRTILSRRRKIMVFFISLFVFLTRPSIHFYKEKHNSGLHDSLDDLPGSNCIDKRF